MKKTGRLPTFLIIGAPKSGTTSLAIDLGHHAEVFMSAEKELHFFDKNHDRGLDWYQAQFEGSEVASAVGEATPTYLYSDDAIVKMAAALPDAKLIAVFRNPVDRAYSLYWWNRALFERRTFEEAVRAEMGKSSRMDQYLYLEQGRYLQRMKKILEYYPRESLYVQILEDLARRPAEEYAAVCRFIGVSDEYRPPGLGKARNVAYRVRSQKLRNVMFRVRAWRRLPFGLAETIDRLNRVELTYPPIDPELRRELVSWFAEPNAELAAWLGRPLTEWDR